MTYDLTMNSTQNEKDSRIKEIVALLGLLVAILVALTTILANSENLPSWWYQFSFVCLVILIAVILLMLFSRKISASWNMMRNKRKQNIVALKYFSEFEDLVNKPQTFTSSVRDISDSLRNHLPFKMNSPLTSFVIQSFNQTKIDKLANKLKNEINSSNKSFREFRLFMNYFEVILDVYKDYLSSLEVIVHEIQCDTGKPMPKGIEDKYSDFREDYNYFLQRVNEFSHKVNKEIGICYCPEFLNLLKKW